MHEILKQLRPNSRVLDLGSAEGSFSRASSVATIVRVDRDVPRSPVDTFFVQADAAALPFADGAFAAVISNNSLEHFENLAGALREIGRVISPGGALFVSVPDASSLTDKIYRWLARGGGHVNPFTSAGETAAEIACATGLPHVATRPLGSSLSFLNRCNARGPLPRRLLLLGGGHEWSLLLYVWLSRRLDRRIKTRSSLYGWAFYFGSVEEPIRTGTWLNVCVRCGSGCSAADLTARGLVHKRFPGFRTFLCHDCGAPNPFSDDYLG